LPTRSFIFYIPDESPFLRMNAVSKFGLILAVSVAALVKLDLAFNLSVFLAVLALIAVSRIPLQNVKMLLYGFAFMAIFLTVMYSLLSKIPGEVVLLELPWGTYITENTFKQALAVAFRMLSLIFAALLFLSTTRDTDIVLGLRALRLPYSVCFMVSLAIRSISMFADDWRTILDAYWSRGVDLNQGSVVTRLRNYVGVLIPLLILTMSKVREIDFAAETRGFALGVKGRTSVEEMSWGPLDYLVLGASALAIALLLSARILGWPFPL